MSTIVQAVADGKPGGGATAVLALSYMLVEAHHRVHLIGEADSYLLAEAARIGAAPHPMRFGGRWRTPLIGRRMAEAINAVEPQVVHAHGARAGLPWPWPRGKAGLPISPGWLTPCTVSITSPNPIRSSCWGDGPKRCA